MIHERKPSPIMEGITYLANLIILNVLFLLCSIPVITYGASFSALITVLKTINTGETAVVKEFFQAFAKQFRQSTPGWLCMMVPGIVMFIEFNLLLQVNRQVPDWVYISLLVPTAAYFAILPWVLLQSAYYYCTLKQRLKNALLLAVQLLPQTVVMMIVQILPVFLFLLRTVDFLRLWPMWLFVYFAGGYSIVERMLHNPMEHLVKSLLYADIH